jgi:hypothetical protein
MLIVVYFGQMQCLCTTKLRPKFPKTLSLSLSHTHTHTPSVPQHFWSSVCLHLHFFLYIRTYKICAQYVAHKPSYSMPWLSMGMKIDSVVMPADFVVWLEKFSEFRNCAEHMGEWNFTATSAESNDAPIKLHYSVIVCRLRTSNRLLSPLFCNSIIVRNLCIIVNWFLH